MVIVMKTICLRPLHQKFLEENPDFNLSEFVRQKLEERFEGGKGA